jgi:hypothetical protein
MKKYPKIQKLLLALGLCCWPAVSSAGVFVSITVAPPLLPTYVQPVCPGDGYLWTPGYWAYGPAGYYWVPGVWVRPPQVGLLWTPGYWGFASGVYGWHAGYWGPHVGFYGGVNYGFGYAGVGFFGGVWSGGFFRYNTAFANVNTTIIHNTYNRTIVNNTTIMNRYSFNGPGGMTARPTAEEQAAFREHHFQPTGEQTSHEQMASRDRNQLASFNHGRPSTMAMDAVNGRRFNEQGRPGPGARAAEQQRRIAQGVRSGQMTPGETERVERREQNINHQISADRRANGGTLTPGERQNINREQNRASRDIYNDKHNGRTEKR